MFLCYSCSQEVINELLPEQKYFNVFEEGALVDVTGVVDSEGNIEVIWNANSDEWWAPDDNMPEGNPSTVSWNQLAASCLGSLVPPEQYEGCPGFKPQLQWYYQTGVIRWTWRVDKVDYDNMSYDLTCLNAYGEFAGDPKNISFTAFANMQKSRHKGFLITDSITGENYVPDFVEVYKTSKFYPENL